MKESRKEILEALSMVTDNGYELDFEVIVEALIYLKENPESSIKGALLYGHQEWIK
jgi:hypothetical protein